MSRKEINNLLLSSLKFIENSNYKRANNLALCLFDADSELLFNIGLSHDEIVPLVLKLLDYSVDSNPNTINIASYQFVCFRIEHGLPYIIELSKKYGSIQNIGILNNLAVAYFKLGYFRKAFEIQEKVISYADSDKLGYSHQKDLIYYNELIYSLANREKIIQKNEKIILNILSSNYVYDLDSALFVAILFDDFDYFTDNYKVFDSLFFFDNEIKLIFDEYYTYRKQPSIDTIQKHLNPMALYDRMFYINDGEIRGE